MSLNISSKRKELDFTQTTPTILTVKLSGFFVLSFEVHNVVTYLFLNIYTVESRLSDLNGTKGQLDNRKCRIIRKTNEKDKGK
jgi:hypothetical protein